MNISPRVKPLLLGTCYVRHGSSYCTGFVRNDKYIISARHVLPFELQKVGLEVGVRLYPFNDEKFGFISRVGEGSVDIIEITLADTLISKTPTATTERSNPYN